MHLEVLMPVLYGNLVMEILQNTKNMVYAEITGHMTFGVRDYSNFIFSYTCTNIEYSST